jgi:uncharacterized repeat protein (TIGR01451 family)
MDKTYHTATYPEDIAAIRQSNKVSEEDIELLTKYIVVSTLAGNNLQEQTYEQILDKLKELRQENTDHNSQAELEQEAKRERLKNVLSVSLTDKNFSKFNKKDCIIYTVIFQNNSTKNINMIVGNVTLHDLLDREIKKIDIVFDENLKASAAVTKTYTLEYDYSSENDKRIRSKELIDLRIVWNPDKIIFEDGTIAD